jgi:ferric-dicitrate binding protein FerR (iron transport regulator)
MAERARPPHDAPDLERLLEVARRATSGEADAARHARGRERLDRALEAREDRAALRVSSPAPWLAAAGLAAAIAVALVVAWPRQRLDVALEGASLNESYLRAGATGAVARFSDGTEIRFAPGTRGRIADVTSRGARVSIEEGRTTFRVVPRPRAEWIAQAGPFSIRVTGTEFDASWAGEHFELDLREGSVVVKGPLASNGIALRAGQRLVADIGRAELKIVERTHAVASSRPAEPAPATTTEKVAEKPDAPASTTKGDREPAGGEPKSASSWRALVASGAFRRVLAEARARGIQASLDETSLSDLAALADAARYAGEAELSRRALLAERARFPRSAEARSAAFLLGRMAESSSATEAIGWYDRYLGESPGGTLAGEALGRKMLAVRKAMGNEAARPIAEEYVRRHPQGPFAAVAEEISGRR